MPQDCESSQQRSKTDGFAMMKSIEFGFSNLQVRLLHRRFRHCQPLHRRSYHSLSTSTVSYLMTKIVLTRERLDLQRREALSQITPVPTIVYQVMIHNLIDYADRQSPTLALVYQVMIHNLSDYADLRSPAPVIV
ncbi:hypothetical protein L484_017780 [Morus notabilis]|uniref:Uncharacterized protein n=1 Tax=Morus notabilis TaxID=981085 RepID=W9RDV2_9ROSA|nr:hypothetical protein L484_017780 [Morus notabilis]